MDWVFFPVKTRSSRFAEIKLHVLKHQNVGGAMQKMEGFFKVLDQRKIVTDEGRETRGNYQSTGNQKADRKTKTANDSIYDAAFQVALATQFFTTQMGALADADTESVNLNYVHSKTHVIAVPIILTTANLKTCHFDAKDVSVDRGEIDFERVELKEQPYLIYRFPLPRQLQTNQEIVDLKHEIEVDFVTMDIAVVNSQHLGKFVDDLSKAIYHRQWFAEK